MSKIGLGAAAVMAAALACPADALAQRLSYGNTARAGEMDPAKRIPPPAAPAPAREAPAVEPAYAAPAPAAEASMPPAAQAPAYTAAPTRETAHDRGGAFIGVQGGRGWVYEDIDQPARMVNAGYRWQAGPVALVGIEAAAGRLGSTREGRYEYEAVDFHSLGANARFNFGTSSPVFAIVRTGYWLADNGFDEVDGAYVGFGLGADVNRHFNVSLIYTNHVYFEDYYWEGGDFYYDINRADTLTFGVEARF